MITFENLQQGHRYYLKNYSEETKFEIVEILSKTNCIAKHLDTLEVFQLTDLIQFGIGDDYELHEI